MSVPCSCFNLVIERLVISGIRAQMWLTRIELFQSRNRDAFHFKLQMARMQMMRICSFNLAIEMLFISSCMEWVELSQLDIVSISQSRCFSFQVDVMTKPQTRVYKFQSRNRDAFHFKAVPAEPLTRLGRTPTLLPACIFSTMMHANCLCKNSVQSRHIRLNLPSARDTGIPLPFP